MIYHSKLIIVQTSLIYRDYRNIRRFSFPLLFHNTIYWLWWSYFLNLYFSGVAGKFTATNMPSFNCTSLQCFPTLLKGKMDNRNCKVKRRQMWWVVKAFLIFCTIATHVYASIKLVPFQDRKKDRWLISDVQIESTKYNYNT